MKTDKKYFNNLKVLYVLFLLVISLFSCNKGDEGDVLFTGENYQNIMQYIDANSDFASFNKIVKAGKMTDALSAYNSNGGIDYTLFLPTNEAVTKYINESDRYSSLDALLQDAVYCAEIVRYHLVNGRIPSNEFPNGALANKTISNYYLTIFFREENNSVTFSVNDEAKVLTTDIDLANGIIHTIDKMLTPVVFTSYEWVEQNSDFTIFTELLNKCGLADTLNAFKLDELGREVYNEYTLFAESNSLYAANGILSFEDLIAAIDPSGSLDQDFTSSTNAVNKYARYHILERSVFLDEFATEVYNTYGDLPVSVDLDDILKVNTGTMVFDSIIHSGDTILVNYLQVNIETSNIVTRSGAIHQLDHLLYPFLPGRKTVTFEFHEEPVINALRNVEGEHSIADDDLEFISLIGTRNLVYIKSPNDIRNCANNDYILISGDVDFSFKTPKILAGRYELRLIIQRGFNNLASFQTLVDDKKVGVVVDAKVVIGNQPTGFNNNDNGSVIGTLEFTDYSTHRVKLSTVIPGRLLIDRIILRPI
jgi:uncharacterized surface protein with fasciclin (FAS1) repeats